MVDVSGFPLINPDIIAESGYPPMVKELRAQIAEADAVIVSFPNHNSMISAVMKNVYDWVSISFDGQSPVKGKPFAVMNVSKDGSSKAVENFKRVTRYCKVDLLERHVLVDGSQ